jgi:hypothetical protein
MIEDFQRSDLQQIAYDFELAFSLRSCPQEAFNARLLETSARSVAVACSSQSLVPPLSYLFYPSEASLERIHPKLAPFPSHSTAFTLFAHNSRADISFINTAEHVNTKVSCTTLHFK